MGTFETNKAKQLIEDKIFLMENINLLDSYDLKESLNKLKKVKFENDTQIHFNYIESKVSLYDDYEKIKTDGLKAIEKVFDIDQFRTITNIYHAVAWKFFRPVKDTKDKFRFETNQYWCLFEFLNFILSDETNTTYTNSQDLETKYKLMCGETVVIPELNNISFKPFLNGNIQIKGLTTENLEKMNKWSELIMLAKRHNFL